MHGGFDAIRASLLPMRFARPVSGCLTYVTVEFTGGASLNLRISDDLRARCAARIARYAPIRVGSSKWICPEQAEGSRFLLPEADSCKNATSGISCCRRAGNPGLNRHLVKARAGFAAKWTGPTLGQPTLTWRQ